jgi:hypothetical protein
MTMRPKRWTACGELVDVTFRTVICAEELVERFGGAVCTGCCRTAIMSSTSVSGVLGSKCDQKGVLYEFNVFQCVLCHCQALY